MYFSKNLRYLRRKAELSQDFIAEKFGYKSYTTIQKWETGTSEPSISNLKILSELFNVNMHEFINVDIESNEANKNNCTDNNEKLFEIDTIAAHAMEDLTEGEIDEVLKFIKFQKMQREDND